MTERAKLYPEVRAVGAKNRGKPPVFQIIFVLLQPENRRKERKMATYTVTINERTNAGRQLLNYLLGLGLVKDKVMPRKKTGFEEAEADIEAGRVYTAKSASDLFNQLMQD